MIYDASDDYRSGFLDGMIKMALSSCKNEYGYRMSAVVYDDRETLLLVFSEKLRYDEIPELIPSEKNFPEICRERFGTDRKSRKAILELEDMMISEFGEEKDLLFFRNDREIKDDYSGYGGGDAPYYIVTQLFVMEFEHASVMMIIGSDE